MRVFLPSTMSGLVSLRATGQMGPAPLVGRAVTPTLRESYASGDTEELEYAALTEAARASLRMLAADGDLPRRRVVVAAEVPEEAVTRLPSAGRACVQVATALPLAWVDAIHVDDEDAVPDVSAAASALAAADAGDLDARFTVDGAEAHELAWYATQELPDLLAPP